jgi:hypothetical protein
MLRHTFVTTMLDATMRYDRASKNLDHHANYILATFMASGT